MRQLIISVHGIRTFGGWQERLAQLLKTQATDRQITVTNYKFGYFSVVAFIIPFLRWYVVRQFRKFLIDKAKEQAWDRIDLVGHSFGTHVIAWALYGIDEEKRPPVHTILFASSVLKSNFPWQRLLNHPVKRVINDCAVKDAVLIFSQLAVLFTGMAGQLGFNGGTGDNFVNRFFDHGHSGYFIVNGQPDDTFMRKYWIPLLVTDAQPILVDTRQASAFGGIRLTVLNNAEPIKLVLYITLVGGVFYWIYGLYSQASASFETTNSLLTNFAELISENVQPIAQLATVESLLQNVQQAINRLPAKDTRLAMQRARMFIVLSEIKREQGDISRMHEAAKQAHDLMAPLTPTADNNPEALHLLARSNNLIAQSIEAKNEPNLSHAWNLYQEALGQLQQLEKQFDANQQAEGGWRWLRSLAMLRRDIGDFLLSRQTKVNEAEKSYETSLETFQRLKRLRPVDAAIDYELAWAANKFGDVLWQQGKAEQALDQYETAHAGITALGEPNIWANLNWRRSLCIVHNNIGIVLRHKTQFQKAIEAFERGDMEIDKLLQRDSNHVNWRGIRAWTYDMIGETKVRWARTEQNRSRLEGARNKLETAKKMRDQLVRDAPDNDRWRVEPRITAANIAALNGTTKEFDRDFRGAALDFLEAVRNTPEDVKDERQEEMILRKIEFLKWAGLDYLKAGRRVDGREQLQKAKDIAEEHIAQATNREPFSTVLSELNRLLVENQP